MTYIFTPLLLLLTEFDHTELLSDPYIITLFNEVTEPVLNIPICPVRLGVL